MTLEQRVEHLLGSAMVGSQRLAGGDLSQVLALHLADGRRVVAKTGAAAAEAAMLRAIGDSGARAPAVLAVDTDLLILEWIDGAPGAAGAWRDLADMLARLHAVEAPQFGWSTDYQFGAVAIHNHRYDDWPGFWADNRLRCHIPHVDGALGRRIETLADRIDEYLPARPRPALLHGDLWGGNILASGGRIAALIDPACYHGDREVDFAMLTLFDHPPDDFPARAALDPGWRERLPVYRLWPLLVHLRLFGGGYRGAVATALDSLGV